MRRFKKSICTILSLCLVITLNYTLLAKADTFSKDGIDPNNYDIYKITFPDSKKVIKDNDAGLLTTDEINNILKDQEKQNIKKAKQEVNKLELKKLGYIGLEEAYLNELNSLLTDDAYLEDYTIYVPKTVDAVMPMAMSTPVAYGTYDGFKFQASFSVYNESYRVTTTDWTKIDSWVDGAINFGMNFAATWVSIPLSVLGIVANTVTVYSGSWIDVTTSEEITSRFILIQDLNMVVTPNPNTYVTVLNDMSKIVSIYSVLYPNSPYSPPSYQGQKGPVEVPSKNFYNRTATMSTALNFYLTYGGYGMYRDLVPRGTAVFK